MLGVALAATVLTVQSDVHRAWRLGLFIPFFVAASGAWQGLFRTCPGLAYKGVRERPMGGEEPLARNTEVAAARRLAVRVWVGSIATAVLSTTIVLLLP